jgi:hypothetical protein
VIYIYAAVVVERIEIMIWILTSNEFPGNVIAPVTNWWKLLLRKTTVLCTSGVGARLVLEQEGENWDSSEWDPPKLAISCRN